MLIYKLKTANATSGDNIWVAKGTYKPTSGTDRNATFQLKNGVGIYGGFAGGETSLEQRNWKNNETILSGNIGNQDINADNSYNVVRSSLTNNTTILDGFTVRDGNATGGINDSEGQGGGIYNFGGSPTLNNLVISNNNAQMGGGLYNRRSSPTLNNVEIKNNISRNFGGGLYNFAGNSTLTNVDISNNTAQNGPGGGLYIVGSTTTLINAKVTNNRASSNGGGIQNYNRANLNLINTTVSGNSARRGGGINNDTYSNITVRNSILSGNSASSSNPEFRNYNSFSSSERNDFIFENSIVKGSGGSGNWNSSFGIDAGGNLDVDPKFVGGGDFSLKEDSPAVNAGNKDLLPVDANDFDKDGDTDEKIPVDLAGKTRVFGEQVDMGAFEFQKAPGGASSGNLQFWLKADAGVTETDGKVSTWVDQSGKGIDVSQTVRSSQPMFEVGGNDINNQSVISFDGDDEFLNSNNFPFPETGSDASIFVVSKADNNTQLSQILSASSDDGLNRFLIHAPVNGTVYWDLGNITTTGRLQVPTSTNDAFHLWSFQSESGSGQNIFKNGNSIASDGDVSTFNPDGKGIRIGLPPHTNNYGFATLREQKSNRIPILHRVTVTLKSFCEDKTFKGTL